MNKECSVWWLNLEELLVVNCPLHTPESAYTAQPQPILFMKKFGSSTDKIFWLVFKKILESRFSCGSFQFLKQCVNKRKHFGRLCLARLWPLVPMCTPGIEHKKMLSKWHFWQMITKYLACRWSHWFYQSFLQSVRVADYGIIWTCKWILNSELYISENHFNK